MSFSSTPVFVLVFSLVFIFSPLDLIHNARAECTSYTRIEPVAASHPLRPELPHPSLDTYPPLSTWEDLKLGEDSKHFTLVNKSPTNILFAKYVATHTQSNRLDHWMDFPKIDVNDDASLTRKGPLQQIGTCQYIVFDASSRNGFEIPSSNGKRRLLITQSENENLLQGEIQNPQDFYGQNVVIGVGGVERALYVIDVDQEKLVARSDYFPIFNISHHNTLQIQANLRNSLESSEPTLTPIPTPLSIPARQFGFLKFNLKKNRFTYDSKKVSISASLLNQTDTVHWHHTAKFSVRTPVFPLLIARVDAKGSPLIETIHDFTSRTRVSFKNSTDHDLFMVPAYLTGLEGEVAPGPRTYIPAKQSAEIEVPPKYTTDPSSKLTSRVLVAYSAASDTAPFDRIDFTTRHPLSLVSVNDSTKNKFTIYELSDRRLIIKDESSSRAPRIVANYSNETIYVNIGVISNASSNGIYYPIQARNIEIRAKFESLIPADLFSSPLVKEGTFIFVSRTDGSRYEAVLNTTKKTTTMTAVLGSHEPDRYIVDQQNERMVLSSFAKYWKTNQEKWKTWSDNRNIAWKNWPGAYLNWHNAGKPTDQVPNELKVTRDRKIAPAELEYLEKRAPKMRSAMESKNLLTGNILPTVGIVFTGGGYRATISALGYLAGAKNSGILDMSSYMTGLSGSTWAIMPWVYSGLPLEEFQNFLKVRMSRPGNIKFDQMDSTENLTYRSKVDSLHGTQSKPKVTSWVGSTLSTNLLGLDCANIRHYGAALGNCLLYSPYEGGSLNSFYAKLSDLRRQYVTHYERYPYAIATAVHKKIIGQEVRHIPWLEFSAHRAGVIPFSEGGQQRSGYWIDTQYLGSSFDQGVVTQFMPEVSLGHLMGIWGSASTFSFAEMMQKYFNFSTFYTMNPVISNRTSIIPSGTVPNFLKSYPQDSLGLESIHLDTTSDDLALTDGGWDILESGGKPVHHNFASMPLLWRGVDVLIFLDSGRLKSGDGRGAGSHLRAAKLRAKLEGLPFPEITEDAFHQIKEDRDGHAFVFGREDPNSPTIVYMKLTPDPEFKNGFDPGIEEFTKTENFVYTPEQFDLLSGLAKRVFEKNQDTIYEVIRDTAQKTKNQGGIREE